MLCNVEIEFFEIPPGVFSTKSQRLTTAERDFVVEPCYGDLTVSPTSATSGRGQRVDVTGVEMR